MIDFDSSFYFITDSTGFCESEFLYRIEQALSGGVTLLQLREKECSTYDYVELAQKVHIISKRYNVPLIIDDRVDVALAIEAEGVHLGASDMPIKIARKLMGKNKIIGASTKTVLQAKKAYADGANYLGVGAIFPTTTKVKTVLTSTKVLNDICNNVPIPVNAIGGLNKNNIDVLCGIPISGICVVSAVMKSKNPKGSVKELKLRASELGLIKANQSHLQKSELI